MTRSRRMTGNRRIPFRGGCDTITLLMPTRDGKVTVLDKWEGGFASRSLWGSFTTVHDVAGCYIRGVEIWSWRRLHSGVVDLGRGVTALGGEPPQDSPITSSYCYTSGGDYCAPRCWLLSSSVWPYPQQVQQSLPPMLPAIQRPNRLPFERLQRRAKLSRML